MFLSNSSSLHPLLEKKRLPLKHVLKRKAERIDFFFPQRIHKYLHKCKLQICGFEIIEFHCFYTHSI